MSENRENVLNFSDLFIEIQIRIFEYLPLNDRVKCTKVCRDWETILNGLIKYQKTLVLGQPELDSMDRVKLSLCNISPIHTATPFNTVDTKELMEGNTENGEQVISELLKKFQKVKAVFIYSPVKMKLSDLPNTVEHIHFGHNTKNVITFDKHRFPKISCISTIDAHMDKLVLDGITDILKIQKQQFQNISICEVPRSLSEQLIEMKSLRQLFVFDFDGEFDNLYKERKLEILDAHPFLQYFNMFSVYGPPMVCPTENIQWLVELGCETRPLNRQFIVKVFHEFPFKNTLEFAKDYIHGLNTTFPDDFDRRPDIYDTELKYLRYLRLTCHTWPLPPAGVKSSLERLFGQGPNLKTLHLRFFTHGIFQDEECLTIMLKTVYAFAKKNSSREILFQLSSLGVKPNVPTIHPGAPSNLTVIFSSLRQLSYPQFQ